MVIASYILLQTTVLAHEQNIQTCTNKQTHIPKQTTHTHTHTNKHTQITHTDAHTHAYKHSFMTLNIYYDTPQTMEILGDNLMEYCVVLVT